MSFDEYKKYAEDVLNAKPIGFSSTLMMVPCSNTGNKPDKPAKCVPYSPLRFDDIKNQKTKEDKLIYENACFSCLSDRLHRKRHFGIYCKSCINGKNRVVAHMKRTAEEKCHARFLSNNNIATGPKKCKTCNLDAVLQGFCRECKRNDNNIRHNLKQNTPLPFEGKCYICKKIPIKKLSLDHDHVTKKARGWLCHHCNILIGFIERKHITRDEFGAYFDYLDKNE